MTKKNILQFAIGPFGAALLSLILLPIIAWMFSPEDVGRLALFNVALSFGTLFFSFGLDQGYVREFHGAVNKHLLFKTALLPGLIVFSCVLFGFLFFDSLLAEMVFGFKSTLISCFLVVALICNFLNRFLSLILRMNERSLAYSMSQLAPKGFLLIIVTLYLLLDSATNFETLLLANMLSISFTCLIFSWNTRRELVLSLYQKMDMSILMEMLKFGFPLIFGGIAFWALISLDRIFLSRWSNFSELAVYSMSVSFAAVATILQSVFSTVWAPTVYKWATNDEGHDKVIMICRYVLMFVIFIFCLAGLFSWIIPLFLPKEYSDVQWVFVACLAYPLFYTLSESTVVGIGIARKSIYAMLACILAMFVNVICNYFLIPKFGAGGAACSLALSFWAFLVFRTEFSIRLWKPLPRLALYTFTFLLVIGSVLGAVFLDYIGLYIYIYWMALLIFSVIHFKRELIVFKYKIMKKL